MAENQFLCLYKDLTIFRDILDFILFIFALKTQYIIEKYKRKEIKNMSNELCIERIEYLKGGLYLINKKLKKLRNDFIHLKITPKKIKEYNQAKKEKRIVKNSIQYFKWIMKQ